MRNGLITNSYGIKTWYQNDLIHRTDGPAIEMTDGTKAWYLFDLLHRTDGPAIEWADGTKKWYQDGLRHRTDGPAVEYGDSNKQWWFKGAECTFNQWLEQVDASEAQKTMMRLQYA